MQIESNYSSPLAASSNSAANAAARIPQKTLGQNDFLKLITVQLTKQDPMKPMEDTSFIAQMAQFTALQQTSDLVSQMGLLRSSTSLASASSLLGQTVTVESKTKGSATGKVDAVDTAGAEPLLVIGGRTFSLSELKRIEPPPPPPAAN